jgi:hypothetical protein
VVDRHAERFALEVPARQFETGEGAHLQAAFEFVGADGQPLEKRLNVQRVLAGRQRGERVLDRRDD